MGTKVLIARVTEEVGVIKLLTVKGDITQCVSTMSVKWVLKQILWVGGMASPYVEKATTVKEEVVTAKVLKYASRILPQVVRRW
jgi:hypothetical protein